MTVTKKIVDKMENKYVNDIVKRAMYFFISKKIKINGYKLYIHKEYDNMSFVLYRNRDNNWEGTSYEGDHIEVCKKAIKEGDIVVDVGANVGYYTVLFSKLAGETGKVYAFEPIFKNYKLLLKNLEANHCTNVIPINCAVSNKNSFGKLMFDPVHLGGASFTMKNGESTAESMTIRLDSFFKEVNFVKIDVEGHEPEVLEGMEKMKFEHLITESVNIPRSKMKDLGSRLKKAVVLENRDYYYRAAS